jgi:hypothetical protein
MRGGVRIAALSDGRWRSASPTKYAALVLHTARDRSLSFAISQTSGRMGRFLVVCYHRRNLALAVDAAAAAMHLVTPLVVSRAGSTEEFVSNQPNGLHFNSYGNHVVGPCADGSVFLADSANFVVKQVFWDSSGNPSVTVIAGTGTKATTASVVSSGVAATTVPLGAVLGMAIQPRTCNLYITERVRAKQRLHKYYTSSMLNLPTHVRRAFAQFGDLSKVPADFKSRPYLNLLLPQCASMRCLDFRLQLASCSATPAALVCPWMGSQR